MASVVKVKQHKMALTQSVLQIYGKAQLGVMVAKSFSNSHLKGIVKILQ